MEFDHLDGRMLLRVLRDPRVEAVAIEYYAHAQLSKLIQYLEAQETTTDSKEC